VAQGLQDFFEALGAVQDHINTVNAAYKRTSDYDGEFLAGHLEDDWHKGDIKKGLQVANVYAYKEQIFIQELTF
jgi:hypothetical protein